MGWHNYYRYKLSTIFYLIIKSVCMKKQLLIIALFASVASVTMTGCFVERHDRPRREYRERREHRDRDHDHDRDRGRDNRY